MARGDFPSGKQDQFNLRFPEGMREEIRSASEKSGRSMNAEIVHRLRATLDFDTPQQDQLMKTILEISQNMDNHITISKVFCMAIMRFEDAIPQECFNLADQMFAVYDSRENDDLAEGEVIKYLKFITKTTDEELKFGIAGEEQ